MVITLFSRLDTGLFLFILHGYCDVFYHCEKCIYHCYQLTTLFQSCEFYSSKGTSVGKELTHCVGEIRCLEALFFWYLMGVLNYPSLAQCFYLVVHRF